MTEINQIQTCPSNVRHRFKDMRAKNKQPGPPFRLLSRCAICTAILEQIITERVDEASNLIPVMTTYILTATGRQKVDSTVERVTSAS